MRRLMFFGLITIAAANLFAADPYDNQTLRGDWIPTKAELGGKAIADAVLKTITLKLADGKYEAAVAGEPDIGIYEIDSTTTNPKGMVIKGTVGPNKGKTFPAIYETEGKNIRICYDLSGEQRPKEFKSKTGTKLYLVTYRRKE